MKKFLVLTLLIWGAGCSTFDRYGSGRGGGGARGAGGGGGQSKVVLPDIDQSLRCIKKAVAAGIPGGIREMSDNRRTYYSYYIDLNGKKWDVVSTDRWRAFADVAILGDRRPYTVEIIVRVEERSSEDPMDSNFKVAGQSAPLAAQVGQRIESKMDICRGDLIDEFRAF